MKKFVETLESFAILEEANYLAEKEMSKAQKDYQALVLYALKEFGVDSPDELKDDSEKKEFFNWLKDNWDTKKHDFVNDEIKDKVKKALKDGEIKISE